MQHHNKKLSNFWEAHKIIAANQACITGRFEAIPIESASKIIKHVSH